jgi:N-acetylmuramoyl-L-alanine amidase
VGRDGTEYRLVDDERRAWHAGKSAYPGYKDVNSQSLGLSFANRHDDTEPLTPAQMVTGRAVVARWRAKYAIADIVTHADVAPQRKTDPLHVVGFNLADFV